ncbi:MAG: NB-ARC domain-containing protein, partial [Planctomycetota bacterium]
PLLKKAQAAERFWQTTIRRRPYDWFIYSSFEWREKVGFYKPCNAFFVKLLRAVQQLHYAGLLHLHLAPSSIYVDEETLEPEICGMGLAAVLSTLPYQFEHKQLDMAFRSPEQIRGHFAGEASDVYSLGALLYFALLGAPPINAETPEAMEEAILAGKIRPNRHMRIDKNLYELAIRCLNPEPFQRCGINEFLHGLQRLDTRTQVRHDAPSLGSEDFFPYDVYISDWGLTAAQKEELDYCLHDDLEDLELTIKRISGDPAKETITTQCSLAAHDSRVVLIPVNRKISASDWPQQQSEWVSYPSAKLVVVQLDEGVEIADELLEGELIHWHSSEPEQRVQAMLKATSKRYWLPHEDNRDTFVEEIRSAELAKAIRALDSHAVCLLHGASGMGKSDLAIYYACQEKAKYDSNIVWISATTDTTAKSDLIEFAKRAPWIAASIENKNLSLAQKIRKAMRYAKLLVLDDVQDADLVKELLRAGRPDCKLLVTSKDDFPGIMKAQLPTECKIKLDKFTDQQSRTLLAQMSKNSELFADPGGDAAAAKEKEAAEYLIEKLDGFPYVLSQLGAELAEPITNCVTLRDSFERQPLVALERIAGGEQESLARLIQLQYENLEDENSIGSRKLLQLCCFFHHEQIPSDIFGDDKLEILEMQGMHLGDSLRRLSPSFFTLETNNC